MQGAHGNDASLLSGNETWPSASTISPHAVRHSWGLEFWAIVMYVCMHMCLKHTCYHSQEDSVSVSMRALTRERVLVFACVSGCLCAYIGFRGRAQFQRFA